MDLWKEQLKTSLDDTLTQKKFQLLKSEVKIEHYLYTKNLISSMKSIHWKMKQCRWNGQNPTSTESQGKKTWIDYN